MKTIKQIADELGVSKTAVRKKIENLGLSEKLQTIGNRIEVNERQEMLIKSAFEKKETKTANQNEVSEKTETFRLLSSMVSTLTEQLQEKDKQIEALTKELAEERQHSREQSDKLTAQLVVLADQAQKLQLVQLKPELAETGADQQAAAPADAEEKWDVPESGTEKKWWQFWK